jgi:cellulose biosynthesis protein BcsQ
MVRETAEIREAMADYLETFPTMQVVITERIVFRKAARGGQGAIEMSSSMSDTKANQELMALYKEIFNVEWHTVETTNNTAE